ncbi:MAG TPA: S1 RNA-binding domain-containing protein, partial [Anaerolineales bacterium]|nr:S1 RNA-binding domain-containing protein [Anaerolineales bacterium]
LDQQDFAFKEHKRGDALNGTIVGIEANEILVDIGSKSEGVINIREMEGIPNEVLAELKVGDPVQAVVVAPEDRNGRVVLTLGRAHTDRDWREAETLYGSQQVFEGVVAGHNKGGLIVKIGKVRGFVPASQLVSRGSRGEGGEPGSNSKENRLATLTGQKLQLKIIELDRQRNRLILSERAAMRDWRKTQKEKLLSELREGDVREGRVISLAEFGAFIDLGGADGLAHLSELSWKRVNHPREVLKVGQTVRVQVIHIDPERKRIGLSLKRVEADPWSHLESRYQVGQLVEGTITKLAKFGAFARIQGDEEIEGLIHISELSDSHIAHPKEVVREGQLVTLRIIRIEPHERRLGLSLKR